MVPFRGKFKHIGRTIRHIHSPQPSPGARAEPLEAAQPPFRCRTPFHGIQCRLPPSFPALPFASEDNATMNAFRNNTDRLWSSFLVNGNLDGIPAYGRGRIAFRARNGSAFFSFLPCDGVMKRESLFQQLCAIERAIGYVTKDELRALVHDAQETALAAEANQDREIKGLRPQTQKPDPGERARRFTFRRFFRSGNSGSQSRA